MYFSGRRKCSGLLLGFAAFRAEDILAAGKHLVGLGGGVQHEVAEAVGAHGDGYIVGQRRTADLCKNVQRQKMVLAQPRVPLRKRLPQPRKDARASLQFDGMTLTVRKAYRLDTREFLQRPGEARRGILAARKQHQSFAICVHSGRFSASVRRTRA